MGVGLSFRYLSSSILLLTMAALETTGPALAQNNPAPGSGLGNGGQERRIEISQAYKIEIPGTSIKKKEIPRLGTKKREIPSLGKNKSEISGLGKNKSEVPDEGLGIGLMQERYERSRQNCEPNQKRELDPFDTAYGACNRMSAKLRPFIPECRCLKKLGALVTE